MTAEIVASGRAVVCYEQILLLPLYVPLPAGERQDGASPEGEVERLIGLLGAKCSPWCEIQDLAEHLAPIEAGKPSTGRAYEEFVYFHEHLHDFLFPRGADMKRRGPWGLRLFARHDLKALRVDILTHGKSWSTDLQVRRMHLYLSQGGVAVLVVELALDPTGAVKFTGSATSDKAKVADLDLDHVLSLQNAVRRIYPPFFEIRTDGSLFFKGYPNRWCWIDGVGKEIAGSPSTIDAHVADFVAEHFATEQQANDGDRTAAIPVANVWRHALEPLRIHGDKCVGGAEIAWRQLGDDRMVSLLHLASPDAPRFTRGEWARLCFADEPRDQSGGDLPYALRFMKHWERRHAYDRFWDEEGSNVGGTRYLITGYSFVMATAPKRSQDDPGDDRMVQLVVPEHLRRHYFRLGLLLVFQNASLLAIQDWTGTVVRRFGETNERPRFRAAIGDLARKFQVFANIVWQPSVSNQMQARELHDQWKGLMGSEANYQAVSRHLGNATQLVEAIEQGADTAAGAQLAGAATVAAVLALPLGFLSIADGIFGKFAGKSPLSIVQDARTFAIVLAVSSLLMWVVSRWAIGGSQKTGTTRQINRFILIILFLPSIAVAIGLAAYDTSWLRFLWPLQVP